MANIGFHPFSYGNTLQQATNIQGGQINNALNQQKFDYNKLNPSGGGDPTAPMRNYVERQRMMAAGASPEDIAIFDNYVRAMSIKEIGGVDTLVGAGGLNNTPLGTLQAEIDANEQLAGGTERGKIQERINFQPEIDLQKINQQQKIYDLDLTMKPKIGAETVTAEGAARHEAGLQAGLVKANTNMATITEKTNLLSSTVARAISQANAMTVGWTGSLMDSVPGTPAHDLFLTILTLESNAVLDSIAQMKATGGTLGQVTEKELPLLKSKYAALLQSASKGAFIRNLKTYDSQQKKSLQIIGAAYAQNYGEPFNMNKFLVQNKGVIPTNEPQEPVDDPLGLF